MSMTQTMSLSVLVGVTMGVSQNLTLIMGVSVDVTVSMHILMRLFRQTLQLGSLR